jgi:hypothetical protein
MLLNYAAPPEQCCTLQKTATEIQQLTKSIDFCQNYVCDCHLRVKIGCITKLETSLLSEQMRSTLGMKRIDK